MCTLLPLGGSAGRNSVHMLARGPVVAGSMCTLLLVGGSAGRSSVHITGRASGRGYPRRASAARTRLAQRSPAPATSVFVMRTTIQPAASSIS